jgi:hypothetical protein
MIREKEKKHMASHRWLGVCRGNDVEIKCKRAELEGFGVFLYRPLL